jgi:hypothetical protein
VGHTSTPIGGHIWKPANSVRRINRELRCQQALCEETANALDQARRIKGWMEGDYPVAKVQQRNDS